MADMQATSGGCNGEGLHERKPRRPSVEVPKNNDDKNQDVSSAESEKEKKTFGRTPDGTGMPVFLLIQPYFRLVLAATQSPASSCTGADAESGMASCIHGHTLHLG